MALNFTFSCSHFPSFRLGLRYLESRCDLFQVLFCNHDYFLALPALCQPGRLRSGRWAREQKALIPPELSSPSSVSHGYAVREYFYHSSCLEAWALDPGHF